MRMKAQVEAMRGLVYEVAAGIDVADRHPEAAERARAQTRVDLLIPVVKAWCTDNAVEICSANVQVHGGMGFIEETGARSEESRGVKEGVRTCSSRGSPEH